MNKLFGLCCAIIVILQFSGFSQAHTFAKPSRSPIQLKISFPTPLSYSKHHQSSSVMSKRVTDIRGGTSSTVDVDVDVAVTDAKSSTWSLRKNVAKNVLGIWGIIQVVSVMANAVKRLIPIALQPFKQNDLQPSHWVLYVAWCLIMAYTEGYKAFQLKFAPMVVSRAFDLVNNPSIFNYLLAGPYSMGMFNASKKRMIVSWAVMAGVFSLVKIVKFLPYPYRSIVDGGVVVGLSYGTLSIIMLSVKALFGGKVVDPDSMGKGHQA